MIKKNILFLFISLSTFIYSQQINITGKVVNASENVVFLVTGKNKAEKIKEIIEQPEQSERKYPAALVKPESGNLIWFIDEEAAELISGKKD